LVSEAAVQQKPKHVQNSFLALLGWVIGYWIVVQFRSASSGESIDFGVLVIALFAAIGVPAIGPLVIERRLPRRSTRAREWDVKWGISSLLFCVTLPAASRGANIAQNLSTEQLWLLILPLYPIGAAAQYGLERLPAIRAGIGSHAPWWLAPVAIAALLTAGVGAMAAANGLVAAGHIRPIECVGLPEDWCVEIQPHVPVLPTWLFAGLALTGAPAAIARLMGYAHKPALLASAIYVLAVYWSEQVWDKITEGTLQLPGVGASVLTLQVLAGVLILAAIVVGSALPIHPATRVTQPDRQAATSS
jgi:hypothetical protein